MLSRFHMILLTLTQISIGSQICIMYFFIFFLCELYCILPHYNVSSQIVFQYAWSHFQEVHFVGYFICKTTKKEVYVVFSHVIVYPRSRLVSIVDTFTCCFCGMRIFAEVIQEFNNIAGVRN